MSEVLEMQKARLLGAMANPKRLQILEVLSQREMPVGELAKSIGISQSALSQHLGKLRQLGLVKRRREEQYIFYRGSSAQVAVLLKTLERLFMASEAFSEEELISTLEN